MAGGGKSNQSQSSSFTDNRAVLGEGSLYANNGAQITSTNYVLDSGAIGDSFKFGATIGGGALDLAGNVFGDGTALVDKALGKVLNFASDSQAGAFDANRFAITQAFNFGDGALSLADAALDSNTRHTDAVLGASNQVNTLVANAYNDAKGRGALTDKIIIGTIAAMALVAYFALRGR